MSDHWDRDLARDFTIVKRQWEAVKAAKVAAMNAMQEQEDKLFAEMCRISDLREKLTKENATK